MMKISVKQGQCRVNCHAMIVDNEHSKIFQFDVKDKYPELSGTCDNTVYIDIRKDSIYYDERKDLPSTEITLEMEREEKNQKWEIICPSSGRYTFYIVAFRREKIVEGKWIDE